MARKHRFTALTRWLGKLSPGHKAEEDQDQPGSNEDLVIPKPGDLFIEDWSHLEVIVTGANRTQVTTCSRVDGSHKVYPVDMFWRLHAAG